jgi:quinoprotein relay system zinc metallohydrolase 2
MGRLKTLAAAALGLLAAASAGAAPIPFEMTEVAQGDYVRRGADEDVTRENNDAIANIGFIVGRDAVAIVDPGGSLDDGKRLRASVRARTDKPIRYVIMTHGHPDHVFGGVAFSDDHPIYVGHVFLAEELAARGAFYRRRLAEILGEGAAGDFVPPTLKIDGRSEIDLGGRPLVLDAHGPAHTDNDLTVLDRATGTLWAGDLLFVGRVPSIDGSISGWLKELAVIEALPALRAVPGHGPAFVPWPAGAADEKRYLQAILTETRAVLAKGGDIEQAISTVGLSERRAWKLFDAYNGGNVTEAFRELEWE